jgi:hypothetical protein
MVVSGLADLIPPVAEAFLKDQITIGHALLIAKLPASHQQEAVSAAFRGLWTSEGNSQVLIPVRELALCGAPHKANNGACVFMQSAAAWQRMNFFRASMMGCSLESDSFA